MTKEEISLCKQVAERHRKKIKKGDWVQFHGSPHLVEDARAPEALPLEVVLSLIGYASSVRQEDVIPLWTISDCLEFLKERCKDHVLLIHEEDLDDDEEWYLWFDEYKETQQWDKGKTPLEACLKVVLAVLEEGE